MYITKGIAIPTVASILWVKVFLSVTQTALFLSK